MKDSRSQKSVFLILLLFFTAICFAADTKSVDVLSKVAVLNQEVSSYLSVLDKDFLSQTYGVSKDDFGDITIGKVFKEVYLREIAVEEISGDYRALLMLDYKPIGMARLRYVNGVLQFVGLSGRKLAQEIFRIQALEGYSKKSVTTMGVLYRDLYGKFDLIQLEEKKEPYLYPLGSAVTVLKINKNERVHLDFVKSIRQNFVR